MNATDLPRADEPQVHSEVILTRLARATIELEDLATDNSPSDTMIRIGDETAGVRLMGDLATIQGLRPRPTSSSPICTRGAAASRPSTALCRQDR
jgi:hypothetical protein